MSISKPSEATQVSTTQAWYPAAMLGWRLPRKVAYLHRHPQLQELCLYFWNHQENIPEPTTAQDLIFLLQDVFVEKRGEFKAQKLVIDADLGLDGLIRLICGINTTIFINCYKHHLVASISNIYIIMNWVNIVC